jgi:hypothetical protein
MQIENTKVFGAWRGEENYVGVGVSKDDHQELIPPEFFFGVDQLMADVGIELWIPGSHQLQDLSQSERSTPGKV